MNAIIASTTAATRLKEPLGMPATLPHTDPFVLFQEWMAEAEATEPADANAMTLATTTPDGHPSARIVLLKGADPGGLVFYTNKRSRKAGELAANARASLLFHWKSLRRQIRVEGHIVDATDAEADAYHASRARVSRLGAWASDQSRPLADRTELERRLAEYDARFPGENVPRPPHWGGYRVVPDYFEFWQDMPFRLHDRLTFTRSPDGQWSVGRLFP
jgi:pyridoxamine 5'-phosphate oxidase